MVTRPRSTFYVILQVPYFYGKLPLDWTIGYSSKFTLRVPPNLFHHSLIPVPSQQFLHGRRRTRTIPANRIDPTSNLTTRPFCHINSVSQRDARAAVATDTRRRKASTRRSIQMPLATLLNRQTDPLAEKIYECPHSHAQYAFHAAKERCIHSAGEVMHEANVRGHFRNGFEAETYKRAEMATYCGQWNTAGRKIAGIQRAFETASADSHDAAKGGTALKQREKVGDEAEAGVEGQGGQQVEVLGRFCWPVVSMVSFALHVLWIRLGEIDYHCGPCWEPLR